MSDIIIYLASIDDADDIEYLSKKTFFDTFHAQNTKEDMEIFFRENFTHDKIKDELLNPLNYFFIAKINGENAGYCKLSAINKPDKFQDFKSIEICRLYALDNFIGEGIGKALMQYSIQFAAEQHASIIWLGVWEHNQRAIKFYKKFGFEKFDEHEFVLGKDVQNDWLMKKQLNSI